MLGAWVVLQGGQGPLRPSCLCTGASSRRLLSPGFGVSPRSFSLSFIFALRAEPRARRSAPWAMGWTSPLPHGQAGGLARVKAWIGNI